MIELPVQSTIRAVEKRGGIKMSWSHPVPRNPEDLGSVIQSGLWLVFWIFITGVFLNFFGKGMWRLWNAWNTDPSEDIERIFNIEQLSLPVLIVGVFVLIFLIGWIGGWARSGISTFFRLLAYIRPSIKTKIELSEEKIRIRKMAGWFHPIMDISSFPYEIERIDLDEDTGHIWVFAQGSKEELAQGLDGEDRKWIHQAILTWLDEQARKSVKDRYNEIQIRQHPGSLFLAWKLPVQKNAMVFGDAISTLFWMGGWLFGEAFALIAVFASGIGLWKILHGEEEMPSIGEWVLSIAMFCFLMYWIYHWTRGGIAGVLSLLSFFGPAPRTEVILKNNRMILRLLYARILPVGKRKLKASEIERIAFEEIEGLPQIKVYLENDEFVIGETLVRSDREKLFGILQAWFWGCKGGRANTAEPVKPLFSVSE